MLSVSEEFDVFYMGHAMFLGALRRNIQNPLKFCPVQLGSVGLAHTRGGISELGPGVVRSRINRLVRPR